MQQHQDDFIGKLTVFNNALKNTKLPNGYYPRYIALYISTKGTKKNLSYKNIATEWVVEVPTARKIMNKLKIHNVIRTSQETTKKERNNRGYLFIEPLVHPISKRIGELNKI